MQLNYIICFLNIFFLTTSSMVKCFFFDFFLSLPCHSQMFYLNYFTHATVSLNFGKYGRLCHSCAIDLLQIFIDDQNNLLVILWSHIWHKHDRKKLLLVRDPSVDQGALEFVYFSFLVLVSYTHKSAKCLTFPLNPYFWIQLEVSRRNFLFL